MKSEGLLCFDMFLTQKPPIIAYNFEPALNVSCAVAEAVGGFRPDVVNECRRTDFSNQLFFTVEFTIFKMRFYQVG